MNALLSLDQQIFHGINHGLANPVLDWFMPILGGHPLFIPALLVLIITLYWRGPTRTRVFILVTALTLALGELIVVSQLKEIIARPRPFMELADARVLIGKGGSGSFPSSHTTLWMAAATLTWCYFRKVGRWLFAAAALMAFSRVYLGVHYPSDVLGGMLIGFGYAISILWILNELWKRVVLSSIPELRSQLPSLLPSQLNTTPSLSPNPWSHNSWLNLGYLLIGSMLIIRFAYLAAGRIGLSEDEAYQWLWSKHLALSYYSKPPMIAVLQWIGTQLWGDSLIGVRFCSPILSALLSLLLLRFFAREVSARFSVGLLVILSAVPILAVGSTLMTVDPPLVFFWMCALCLYWRALQPEGTFMHWCLAGLCTGLATLSKYAGMYQWICLALFLAITPKHRRQFLKPGFWTALFITLICQIPVVVWNAQHQWATVHHVKDNASRSSAWSFTPNFFYDFLAAQAGLLNPVFFVAIIAAMIGFYFLHRKGSDRPPLLSYLFWMGAPVFLGYAAFTVYKRVFPNWIAPSIVPLMAFAWLYWSLRWKQGARWVKPVLVGGIVFGLFAVILVHDTRLIGKISGKLLPPELDPHRRVLGWQETAEIVETHRVQLAREGKETFVIGTHYGIVGQMTFWTPAARAALASKSPSLVYYKTSPSPQNQFYFWPTYVQERHGQNAILVQEIDGRTSDISIQPDPQPVPDNIQKEFRSVQEIGIFPVIHRGRILRWIQLFACRDLQ